VSRGSHLAALARFAIASNPLVLVMPLPWLGMVGLDYWEGNTFRFDLTNLWSAFSFLMVPQVALVLFAPGLWSRDAAGANPMEFLLTRALDRRQYFRAMTLVYVAIGLLPSICGLLLALSRPTLEVIVLDDARMGRYLSAFDGSYRAAAPPSGDYQPPTIVIPHGRVMVAAVDAVNIVALSMLVLALLLLLMKTRRRPLVAQIVLMAPVALVVIGAPFWTLANRWVELAAPRVAMVAAVVIAGAFAAHRLYERWYVRLEVVSG